MGSLVNLLHIFRTPFRKKTSGGLLLQIIYEDVYESIIMKAAKILSSYSFETASSQLRKTFKSFVERLCLEKK